MRLGELKSTLDLVLSNDNRILLHGIPLYGHKAYRIENYSSLVRVLKVLDRQKWNTFDSKIFSQTLIPKYGEIAEGVTVTATEYHSLAGYVNNLNSKIQLYYSILETLVTEQEEQLINIRLPEKDNFTFEELSQINNRLDVLFSTISIDGGYEFRGFDVGEESWYKVLLLGTVTYRSFMVALKIAQDFYKTDQEYYASGLAKLSYEIAIGKKESDEEKIKLYCETVTQRQIEMAIERHLDELPIATTNKDAVQEKLQKVISLITEELDRGLEFHLSLNPPKYALEDQSKITINYEIIRRMEMEKANQVRQNGMQLIKNYGGYQE